MEKVDVKELLETVYDAQKYLGSLKVLEKELKIAEKQIINSAEVAEREVEEAIGILSRDIQKVLEDRKQALILEIRNVRNKSLGPLKSSQLVISDKLQETNKLIDLSKEIKSFDAEEFNRKASLLGSLPEVPELKEVSYITFQTDTNNQNNVISLCSNFGSISRIAPIQICDLIAKPGAILVEWEVLDSDDHYAEIQEYHLQKAFGNAKSCDTLVFHDCYKGPELQYLAQDLKPNQEYSFRIRCKFEGCSDYSPWSLIQIAITNIDPYCWMKNPDYQLSNESKVATSLNDSFSTIISNGPQFALGNTLDFTFVEIGDKLKENFIGLLQQENVDQDWKNYQLDTSKEGSFLLEASGDVYIDGSLKSTKLPPIRNGSKVSFMSMPIGSEKIRVNIDVSDKRVTYDWNTDPRSLFFVARFSGTNWKVLVE